MSRKKIDIGFLVQKPVAIMSKGGKLLVRKRPEPQMEIDPMWLLKSFADLVMVAMGLLVYSSFVVLPLAMFVLGDAESYGLLWTHTVLLLPVFILTLILMPLSKHD